jgi:hypothetical protein
MVLVDGVVVGMSNVPPPTVGFADGNWVGKVYVGDGTNNISHELWVASPFVQPSVAAVVVIADTVNAVGLIHVGSVVKSLPTDHGDGFGVHTTLT